MTRPEELSQKVFLILLETTVARGASTPGQIRRSYLSLQHDHKGRREVRVHGNARRKTMPGRAADYRAIDVTVYGKLEVILGQTLLYLGLSLEIPWEIFTFLKLPLVEFKSSLKLDFVDLVDDRPSTN